MGRLVTFFRHCPSCGRRYHVRLEGEKLAGSEVQEGQVVRRHRTPRSGLQGGLRVIVAGRSSGLQIGAGITEPAQVVVEVYELTYKCEACGHEWKESRKEVDEIGGGEEGRYRGD
ncbi:MAG: hypothetical protein HY297_06040 [Thaumarchaeota archaeon]|nr:hypothetical protein [Nitrososphaerota archaeon]